ncbi:MAG: EpsG family protein [Prevotellaceae bacterium]|jgi:hypothetical protein|nr:EpsG family protein [Prevotellaceae bacterium]
MEVTSYTYAIPYLIFLGGLCLLPMHLEFRQIYSGQSTRATRRFTVIVFLFFCGLRGFVITDWYGYYPYFLQLKTLWSGGLRQLLAGNATFDVGFELYSMIIKSVCPSYFFWVFASTAIDLALLHIVFRRYARYYVFAFAMFFVFGGEVIAFNLMRNIKSILLFLLSLKYLQERKILPYMLLNVLGMSFHVSSVAYLPLYFVLHRQFPRWLLWAAFIAGNVLFLLQLQYIQPLFTFLGNLIGGEVKWKVAYYFLDQSYGISIGYVERTLTFIVIMLLRSKLKRQSDHNLLFINLYMAYAFSFLYFGESHSVTLRMSYLFVGAYWILLPNMLALFRRRRNKELIVLILVAYSFIKMLLLNVGAEMRYDNLMFGIKPYQERKEVFEKIYKKGKYAKPESQQKASPK